MYAMHHAFRRDLAAFARAVPATPVDDRPTWSALQQRWTRFAEVLHHHHTGEDSGLWPLLLTRVDAAGDERGRATLEAMESEHGQIDPLLEACAEGFARMAAGGTADERAARPSDRSRRDSLGRHLEHEETEALALVQRHLTRRLDRMEQEHFKGRRCRSPRRCSSSRGCATACPSTSGGGRSPRRGRAFLVAYALTRAGSSGSRGGRSRTPDDARTLADCSARRHAERSRSASARVPRRSRARAVSVRPRPAGAGPPPARAAAGPSRRDSGPVARGPPPRAARSSPAG
jgi:hypothetical protein